MTKFTSIENALRLCAQIGFDVAEHLSFELTDNETVLMENDKCGIEVGTTTYSYWHDKSGNKAMRDKVEFTIVEAEILRDILKM